MTMNFDKTSSADSMTTQSDFVNFYELDDKVEFDICGGLRREMSDCGQTLPSPHYTSNIRMQETRMLSGLPPHSDGFTASKTEAIKRSQFVTKTKYVLTL